MATNLGKTLTDAGYIAVGLGVMGVQQAQIRGRELYERTTKAGDCVTNRARDSKSKLDERSRAARAQAEEQVRTAADRTKALRDELTKRVEPVAQQVQGRLGQLPERVVQAMEPVAARVREIAGTAA